MSLWREVRSNLGEWTTQAAERGEKLARVGMHQVDRYGIHRRLSRQFTELGGEIHAILAQGEASELLDREKIRAIMDRIGELERELKAKEAEIAALKQKSAATADSEPAAEGPQPDPEAEEATSRENPREGESPLA